jgi:hypothetical protein
MPAPRPRQRPPRLLALRKRCPQRRRRSQCPVRQRRLRCRLQRRPFPFHRPLSMLRPRQFLRLPQMPCPRPRHRRQWSLVQHPRPCRFESQSGRLRGLRNVLVRPHVRHGRRRPARRVKLPPHPRARLPKPFRRQPHRKQPRPTSHPGRPCPRPGRGRRRQRRPRLRLRAIPMQCLPGRAASWLSCNGRSDTPTPQGPPATRVSLPSGSRWTAPAGSWR